MKMKKFIVFLTFSNVIASISCATQGILRGSVSTEYYSEPADQKKFVVILQNPPSLRDKQIGELISKKLLDRGYVKVADFKDANTAVLFKYSIGQGVTSISSSPDFVFGGQKVQSSTRYPRFFQLFIVNLLKSKPPEHVELIWQGEVYSEGSTSDIMKLAEYFINVLFENYGSSVKSKPFSTVGVF